MKFVNILVMPQQSIPRIEYLKVQNYRALHNLELKNITPLTTFLGPNYPKISPNLVQQKKYRNPNTITGGNWEALEKVLQSKGYHKGGLEKNNAAREIGQYMNPKENCSKSFQVFYQGLLEIIE